MTVQEAVRSLADHLLGRGILHAGIGHRPPFGREIVVYLPTRRQIKDIPNTWEGYPVEKIYSGKMRAL